MAQTLGPITSDEAARVACALHYGSSLNLSPFLSAEIIASDHVTQEIDVEGILTAKLGQDELKHALQSFHQELSRLRLLRSLSEVEATQILDNASLGVPQCYGGRDGLAFTVNFDFGYSKTLSADYAHELVKLAVCDIFNNDLVQTGKQMHVESRKMLSLGPGDGRWVAEYASACLTPYDEITLVDLHLENLHAAAQSIAESSKISQEMIKIVQADLNKDFETLDVMPSLSLVETSYVLHHIANLTGLLRQIRSWLKPNGKLVVMDVIDLNVKEEAIVHNKLYIPPFHGVEFFRSHKSLLAAVGQAGFGVINYTRVDAGTAFFVAVRLEDFGITSEGHKYTSLNDDL